MQPTYQHSTIANHLQATFGHRKDWPFQSAPHIADQLCGSGLSLRQGEYLVVSLAGDGERIGKVANLEEVARFPSTSLVISYSQLERAFHEQHTEWVEQ
jgi:hypothetical protein